MRPVNLLPVLATCLLMLAASCRAAEPPAAPERISVHTCWTSTTLYFGFRVDDPLVVGNQTTPLAQTWLDDSVAVYLNLDPTKNEEIGDTCVRVVVSAAGGATVQRGRDGEWRDDPSWFQFSRFGTIRYGVDVQGKLNDAAAPDRGYTVEIGLAWGLLGVQPPLRRRPSDPLPAIGMALACYAQGETQSVSCWPAALREEELDRPARWGFLQFTQNMQPLAGGEELASATLVQLDPQIDGKMSGMEWLTAGVVTFPRRQGVAITPLEPSRQAVSLIAAWYTLDPESASAAHQPLEPTAAWLGPYSPYYHLRQIQELRRAGIDAIAVTLPVDEASRERTRQRLAALVSAVKDFDRANSATFFTDTPLLLPIIVLRGGDARGVEAALDDFYYLTPPQFRLTLPDAAGALRYPVLFSLPATPPTAFPALDALGASLREKWGRPFGWLLDAGWPEVKGVDGVLARCAWDPLQGVHTGVGSMRAALIAPGVDAGRKRYLARRDGTLYDNGWVKAAAVDPDFILIRSWNDFADGTEIAPSRRFGAQYRDATRLATIRLLAARKFGVRVLRSNLPDNLLPGRSYPVELTLKNGGMEKMVSREGFQVDYRVMQGEREIAKGTATDRIVLLEMSAARLRFNLPTTLEKRRRIAPGRYTLCLDFRRNKIPQLNLPLMTETVWTVSLPLTIGEGSELARVQQCDLPDAATPGAKLPVAVRVRYPDVNVGKGARVAFRLRWASQGGVILAGESLLTAKPTPGVGDDVMLRGTLPPAPPQAGWYQALLEMTRGEERPVLLHAGLVRVVDADLRAQLLSIEMPERVSGAAETVETPVALRNAGLTDWPAKETSVAYQWLGWDGQPIPHAGGVLPLTQEVKAGGSAAPRLHVPLPPGAGPFRCAFGVACRGEFAALTANPLERGQPLCAVTMRPERFLQVDLSPAWNERDFAAQAEGLTVRGGLDDDGNLFPLEEFLPDASRSPCGFPVGYGVADVPPAWRSTPFFFPPLAQGRAPVIRARGQKIDLPAQPAAALCLAALAVGGNATVPLTVVYEDGFEQKTALKVSSWLGDPANGETVMLRSRWLRTARGDDWDAQGSIFAYRLPLDPKRKPVQLVLPEMPEFCLFAVTLETAPE